MSLQVLIHLACSRKSITSLTGQDWVPAILAQGTANVIACC